jgi:hypothetical protein
MHFTSHPQSEHSSPLNFQAILFTYTNHPELQRFNLPVTLEHISTTATLKGGEQNQKSYHNTARGSSVLFQKHKRTGLRCRITIPITIIIYSMVHSHLYSMVQPHLRCLEAITTAVLPLLLASFSSPLLFQHTPTLRAVSIHLHRAAQQLEIVNKAGHPPWHTRSIPAPF